MRWSAPNSQNPGARIFASAMLLVMLSLALLPSLAFSQAPELYDPNVRDNYSTSRAITAVDNNCAVQGTQTVPDCDCYPGLANRVVGCIRQTLHNASQVYFDPDQGIHNIVAKAIGGIITLGVVIYGVMLAAGMVEKLGRDTFVLLIKIALVSYFVVNTQMLYNLFIDMIDSLASDMFQFSSTGLLGVCMNKFSIWERMDCMIDSVIGIKISTFTSSSFQGFNQNFAGEMMGRGLIGTFFNLMKSSSFGFVIGLLGFVYIYAMLFFLVRTLLAFLMSFFSLTFVMMLGPIFMPLVLFRVTKQYFDKWIRLLISSSLQPILLVTFISFAIAGLDLVMFSGPTSVMRVIAGNAVNQPGFNLNTYIEPYLMTDVASGPVTKGQSAAEDFQQISGVVKGFVEATTTDCLANTVGNVTTTIRTGQQTGNASNPSSLLDCAYSKVNQFAYKAVDVPKLAAGRVPTVDPDAKALKEAAEAIQPPTDQSKAQLDEANRILTQKMQQEMFASIALALMMMFLMFSLMRVVPLIANDLTGEYRFTPGFFNSGGGDLEKQLVGKVAR